MGTTYGTWVKDSIYTNIELDEFNKEVNHMFFGSPIVMGNFIECAKKDKAKSTAFFSSQIKNELEDLYRYKKKRMNLLLSISDDQFNRFECKLFFQFLIYNDLQFIWSSATPPQKK